MIGAVLIMVLAAIGGFELWEAWKTRRVAQQPTPSSTPVPTETAVGSTPPPLTVERCAYSLDPYRVGYFDHEMLLLGAGADLDELMQSNELAGSVQDPLFRAVDLPWRVDSLSYLVELDYQVRHVRLPCSTSVSQGIMTAMRFRPASGGFVFAQPNHLMSASADSPTLKGDPANAVVPIDPDTVNPCCSAAQADAAMASQAAAMVSDIDAALDPSNTLAFNTSKHSQVRVAVFDSSPFPAQMALPTPWSAPSPYDSDVDAIFPYLTSNIVQTTNPQLQRSDHGLFTSSIVKSMAGSALEDNVAVHVYQVLDDHADGRLSELIRAMGDMMGATFVTPAPSPPLSHTVVNLGLSVVSPSTGVPQADAEVIRDEVFAHLDSGGSLPSWFSACAWVQCSGNQPSQPITETTGAAPTSTESAVNVLKMMVWVADQGGASIVAAAGNSSLKWQGQSGTIAAAVPAEWAEDDSAAATKVFTNVLSVAAKSDVFEACFANSHNGDDSGMVTGLDVFGGVDAEQNTVCQSAVIGQQCQDFTADTQSICSTAVVGRVFSTFVNGAPPIGRYGYWAGSSYSAAAVSGYIAKEKLGP